ncbi:choline/ethanolamine kinase family protein [Bradyrhizobium erythrophlei]|jgi:thiamine kinase-like enzyme|uniref:Thiamine kinase n=1 Tax=Bradyrhizobium erythrophlei TaxID=1437360 RepID=A0A1M5Q9T2_9BRAD|nr:choline/ethanolamine kinase family protein [Bradyrhizobium erythrophlei]SHH10636.1 Thiamine kinase [Bradyrhizobium erythrophlei]
MSIKRRAGEATTVHERDLEKAVGRVPQWRDSGFRYAALVGGLTNQNWIVEVDGEPRRYFIKVPGEGSEMFIDRVVANEAARNAHAMELAPEVVFFDPQDGLEVSEFLEGYRACTNADFGDPSIQSDVLSLYRRLHSGPSLGLTKTIFDMIEEHIRQGRDLGSHFPPDMPWIEHRYRQAKAAFMASGLDLVPCFNDPMPGNFLISQDPVADPKPMRLIDYEFASNNERSYELGVLFAEMFYDEQLTLSLIEQYCGTVRPAMVARVIVNRALADIKWASWAVVNRKLKEWDFDYQKYGVWKYMRARSLMYDPRWDGWLRMV